MKIITVLSQELAEAKQRELNSKIQAYLKSQIYQLEHGGPGPVAAHEIMEIVNEHSGEFSVEVIENLTEEN